MPDLGARLAAALGLRGEGGCTAVASWQLGMYCTLRALEVGVETTVACDPIFPFATLAALHAGATVVHPPVVVHEQGYRVLLDEVDADVAVVTLPFGWPLDDAIAPARCPLVLDAAHAPLGEVAWRDDVEAVGLSFAASKPVSSGEGGLVLFRRPSLREACERWGRFGVGDNGSEAVVPGLNIAMSPLLEPALLASIEAAPDREVHLDRSWSVASLGIGAGCTLLPAAGAAGWYRPVLASESAGADDLPATIDGDGVRWKRCCLPGPAADVCGARGAGAGVRPLVERLAWYRPVLDHVGGER